MKAITQQTQLIAQYIREGMEAWIKAGEIVVQLIDEHGQTKEQIAEACGSDISARMIQGIEQIGRKAYDPRLLMATYPAASLIKTLPYSDQKAVLNSGVKLLISKDGKLENMNIRVENLQPEQCKQVFDKGVIRGEAGQRAYIEEQRKKAELSKIPTKAKAKGPYELKQGLWASPENSDTLLV